MNFEKMFATGPWAGKKTDTTGTTTTRPGGGDGEGDGGGTQGGPGLKKP